LKKTKCFLIIPVIVLKQINLRLYSGWCWGGNVWGL